MRVSFISGLGFSENRARARFIFVFGRLFLTCVVDFTIEVVIHLVKLLVTLYFMVSGHCLAFGYGVPESHLPPLLHTLIYYISQPVLPLSRPLLHRRGRRRLMGLRHYICTSDCHYRWAAIDPGHGTIRSGVIRISAQGPNISGASAPLIFMPLVVRKVSLSHYK